ncbi:NAD-dependent epimerase/dehydratase family protein [Hyphomonas sp. WL0036]|uniref:NAD-dependent epimerase/dehydratase family protein n=1 Tax=Hyphomonas sediminis TaxID=2866160 RepID=UPI001C80CD9D|nr:NAD-dependent epimerase/dehydratase family protein [Hyphomonas sediminis]
MRARILIAGGWGLIGSRIAKVLREAGHDLDIVLAGRTPDTGKTLATELGASLVRLDITAPEEGLAAAGPLDLVIAALQDPDDILLSAALHAGAGHIGITRTVDNMASSAITAAACARRPAMMLGHWQAGVLTLAALSAARRFEKIDRVEMAALYDYADPIGPMTESDATGFVGEALIRQNGRWQRVNAPDAARSVPRAGLPSFDAMPMGVLDTPAVTAITGAKDVRFDLGSGDSLGTISGRAASHDLYIDIAGIRAGASVHHRTLVTDPLGQAHLTALGVLIAAERVLGLDGDRPPKGLVFPESTIDPDKAVARLRAFGVSIQSLP